MADWLESKGPPILLALMGGIADFLISEEHSLASLLAGAFLACFVGYMGLLLCVEYQLTSGMTGMICGFLGYTSRTLLIIIKRLSQRKLLQMLFGSAGIKLPSSIADALDDHKEVETPAEGSKTSNPDTDPGGK